MQSAGLFSLESNSDRLISTFRTMLNRKINNQEILEFALEKMDLRENSHTSENLKIDLVTEVSLFTCPTKCGLVEFRNR